MIFNTAKSLKHKRSYVAKMRKKKSSARVQNTYSTGMDTNQNNWKW